MPCLFFSEKFGRSYTCGIPEMKPGAAAITAFSAGRARFEASVRRMVLSPADQCGCRREILCGAFLVREFGISGVSVGLMVGLSRCSGSIEVMWLQASHL
ncbi:hypothetical protein [Bradyrhizobium hereditatis]|uniref:hypothetical protein n=1 Tax=Bradyrhizobium hereditatis TaxID=2821405 RepID=UPI001CE2D4B6|nr:hypothetical protein [Bradyrhizobium hereditatis]